MVARAFFGLGALLVAVALWSGTNALATPVSEASPTQLIEKFHITLLDVMRHAKQLGYKGRYDRLGPAVASTFHLDFMTGVIAGSYWRKFTPTERSTLVEAFRRMTAATYARRFNGYSGEQFKILATEPGRRQSVLVKSRIIKSNGETVDLNYNLRNLDGRWGIVDIHLKGSFSEVATRRSEYSSVLRRSGLEKLLRLINKKIKMFEEDAE